MRTRDFFSERFTRAELIELAALIGVDALFSWKSPSARPYAGQRGRLNDDRLIDLMLGEPRLVRRPLLRTGDELFAGFDQEDFRRVIASRR